ncbi:MAG TPA: hypothetical protein PLX89_27035 [Verrucomicrobiota bacterium]|nr:hypothetical protein [Verrucomicrobiales bacterium]HRI16664.1 hypothetical protein [Verrucomicrobiota bacterium]
MSDFILIDGDKAMFLPAFGAAVVAVQPGTLVASGPASLNGKRVCVDGDETKVMVPGCTYLTPAYSVPGVGTLKIASLAGNQKAKKTKSGKKPVLLKGGNFTAKFEVTAPAQMPPPASTPDSMAQYSGQGMFVTTNLKFTGT